MSFISVPSRLCGESKLGSVTGFLRGHHQSVEAESDRHGLLESIKAERTDEEAVHEEEEHQSNNGREVNAGARQVVLERCDQRIGENMDHPDQRIVECGVDEREEEPDEEDEHGKEEKALADEKKRREEEIKAAARDREWVKDNYPAVVKEAKRKK